MPAITPETSLRPPPTHVAIIMDGNGRWAKQRGLPRLEGHRKGADAVGNALKAAREQGVEILTLYAFSIENRSRPEDEIDGLMDLLDFFLKRETARLIKDGIRLRTIGRTELLPEKVRRRLDKAIAQTAHFTEHTLVLALNYGSRTEVLDAAQAYALDVLNGEASAGTPLSWETFSRYLNTTGLPDPDLVIRTSGEIRISNFLLLQAAYAEFVFLPVLWPDFSKDDFAAAIDDYRRRERRFGRTSEQLHRATASAVPPPKPRI